MCGIVGFLDPTGRGGIGSHELERMARAMAARGPDDSGTWIDPEAGVGLAHRRLSIIDLSAEGHQPMVSASGRYVVVLNGEIYNFQDIRRDLEARGVHFRGHSDTEVALAAIEAFGFDAAVEKLSGMFALALWDREDRCLTLCRDRIGKKPLYYGEVRGAFVFASVLSAIEQYPGFDNDIDRDALALYVRHNYVPAPHSIFCGIRKLQPGCVARFDVRDGRIIPRESRPYWSAETVWDAGRKSGYTGSEDEAAVDLEKLLRDSVRIRMISDVPLGAFLSGGIDSSLVVALMQLESERPVKTFTIGFDEGGYNEAEYAKSVAQHLGTDHTEVYLGPQHALEVIPQLPQLYDEPFSDVSQIPTFLVSRIAREHVTVALSGDGGDEFFCGYNRYLWWRQIWSKLRALPPGVRKIAGRILSGVSVDAWNRILRPLGPLLPNELRHGVPGEKIHKAASIFSSESPGRLYQRLVSNWDAPESIVIGGTEPATILTQGDDSLSLDEFTERMMILDILTYLPDDILVKVDRASMGVSLESRCPLLDHRVLEFAASLPLSFKLRGTTGKLPLRKVLAKYVPESLFERPKAGFGVPIGSWLRGPLREWADELISPSRLREEGFFDVTRIRDTWDGHINHQLSAQHMLWNILMFQAWYDQREYSRVSDADRLVV